MDAVDGEDGNLAPAWRVRVGVIELTYFTRPVECCNSRTLGSIVAGDISIEIPRTLAGSIPCQLTTPFHKQEELCLIVMDLGLVPQSYGEELLFVS